MTGPVPSTCVLRSQAWLPHGVPVWGALGLPYGVTEKHGDLPGCDACGDGARWRQRGQKCFGAVAEPPSGSPEGGQQCSLCPHPRGCTVHPGEARSAERWCGPWSLMLVAPGWFWEVRSGQTWLPCASPDLTWTRALLTRDSRNKKASLLQLLKLSALCRAALRTSGSLVLMVLGNPGFASDLRIWEQKSGRETEPDENFAEGWGLGPGITPPTSAPSVVPTRPPPHPPTWPVPPAPGRVPSRPVHPVPPGASPVCLPWLPCPQPRASVVGGREMGKKRSRPCPLGPFQKPGHL